MEQLESVEQTHRSEGLQIATVANAEELKIDERLNLIDSIQRRTIFELKLNEGSESFNITDVSQSARREDTEHT